MTFTFHLPRSAGEAAELLADAPEGTTLVGGGTLVVPELASGLRRPEHVVDLSRAGLATISLLSEDTLHVGACTTYQQVLDCESLRARLPLLQHVAAQITGGVQIRNQGTIGGAAVAARPHSDIPAVLVALRATLHARSAARGTRQVPAAVFFRGAYEHALDPDELLEAITFPLPVPPEWSYVKLKFGEGSWPIATVVCTGRVGADRMLTDAALVVGAAAAVPLVVLTPAAAAVSPLGPELAEDLARQAERALTEPWSDVLATGEYRRAVVGGLVRRALRPLLAAGDRP